MERKRRERDRGHRLDDLYDRLDRARGLPPEEAVRTCKAIVNDSILDDDEALEADTGVRAETFDALLDALKACPTATPGRRPAAAGPAGMPIPAGASAFTPPTDPRNSRRAVQGARPAWNRAPRHLSRPPRPMRAPLD